MQPSTLRLQHVQRVGRSPEPLFSAIGLRFLLLRFLLKQGRPDFPPARKCGGRWLGAKPETSFRSQAMLEFVDAAVDSPLFTELIINIPETLRTFFLFVA